MSRRTGSSLLVAGLIISAAMASEPPPVPVVPAEIVAWLEGQRGKWRSEGLIIKGEEHTKAFATWECRAAVNGVGNSCTWNHEWANGSRDSALEIIGYDPVLKQMSNTRVGDNGLMSETAAVTVQGNAVRAQRKITENGKPAVIHNEVVVKSPDERSQRMWVEVDGKTVREFIITHRRVK